jgi:hypothetical protein
LDYDEYVECGEVEAAFYAEIAKDLNVENGPEAFDPLVEFEYRRRIDDISATVFKHAPADPANLLREVAEGYRPVAERIDRQRGDWKRHTQAGINANVERGEKTRRAVVCAATAFATAHGLNWRPGHGKAPRGASSVIARRAGISPAQVRKILSSLLTGNSRAGRPSSIAHR